MGEYDWLAKVCNEDGSHSEVGVSDEETARGYAKTMSGGIDVEVVYVYTRDEQGRIVPPLDSYIGGELQARQTGA